MRRRLFVMCALIGALARPASADERLAARYADALRAFNPRLSAPLARTLAERVLLECDAASIDARLIVALVAIESDWEPDARSRAGARGLGQLMPATAATWGVDPEDPVQNVRATVRTVRALLDRYASAALPDRYVLALAAYNAGPGAVERYGGVPPYAETRRYVGAVLTLWRRLVG